MKRLSTEDLAKAEELAGEISQHHADAERAQEKSLEAHRESVLHAIEAGRCLDELWELLGRGHYGRYRDQYLSHVGERMCRYYREARHLYRDLGLEPAMIAGSGFTITGFIEWAKSEKKERKKAAQADGRRTSSGRRFHASNPTNVRTSSGRKTPTPEISNPIIRAYRRASQEQRDEFRRWLRTERKLSVIETSEILGHIGACLAFGDHDAAKRLAADVGANATVTLRG